MKIKNVILATVIAISSLFVAAPVFADGCSGGTHLGDSNCNKICNDPYASAEQKSLAGCDMTSENKDQLPDHIVTIINVAISMIGIIAVIVIVFAGQRILIGGHDSAKLKAAKDMLLYAVIALVVATLSWAIVNYLVVAIGK